MFLFRLIWFTSQKILEALRNFNRVQLGIHIPRGRKTISNLKIFKDMIQFILMLLGLAFGHNNANTSTCNDNNSTTVTVQGDTNPGTGIDPGDPGDTGGDTVPLPPKK